MALKIALAQQEKNSINFSKVNINFGLSFYYTGDENYLYVNKKEICKFETKDSISWYNFCLGSTSKDFTKVKLGKT